MAKQTVQVELTFADGSFEYRHVPAKWVICPDCEGDGTRGNPAFDGMAYPGDEEPEFWDAYFSGKYDVRCNSCDGTGKAQEPKFDSAEDEEAYYRTLEEKAAHAAEIAAERRMGA